MILMFNPIQVLTQETHTNNMTIGHDKTEKQDELSTIAAGGIKSRDYFYGIWKYTMFDTIKINQDINSNIQIMLKLLLCYSEASSVAMISNA